MVCPKLITRVERIRIEKASRIEDRLLTYVRKHKFVSAEGTIIDFAAPLHVYIAVVSRVCFCKQRRDVSQAADQYVIRAEEQNPLPSCGADTLVHGVV